MRLRFELGASSDFTNEQFYEDAFIDTVALGRRLVGDPESQVAAVFGSIFDGTRSRRASGIHLQNELSLGAKLQRDEFRAEWRSLGLEGLQWMVSPWGEYRRDRTFGRDLEEARASGLGRLQYRFPDRSGLAEVSGTVEALRTRGVGADFIPDRNVARMQTHFEHTPLLGTNWSLGYGAVARQFPDSTYRNHLEHQVGAAIHQDMLGGHSVELTSDFLRRSTFEPAPTTEDNFWELDLAGEAIALLGDVTSLIVRPSTESIRYDEPDSTIYFDYDILRALVAPQWTGGSWTARVGPRGELLRSPHDRTEEYREIAGMVELEWTARGGWWSASPAAGWRDYDDEPLLPSIAPSGALLTPSGRSSYAFYELIAIGDQALPGAMRLHLYASGRYERHTDSAQNARSLYFSFDVRRLF